MQGYARPVFDAASLAGNVAGPPTGLRVLDLSRALARPSATLMLADASAPIIAVEQPGTGDDTLGWEPPSAGAGDGAEPVSLLSVARTKRSITLDLQAEAEAVRLRALIAEADGPVEDFRQDVLAPLGLAVEDLMAQQPVLNPLNMPGGPLPWSRSGRRASQAQPVLSDCQRLSDALDVVDGHADQ